MTRRNAAMPSSASLGVRVFGGLALGAMSFVVLAASVAPPNLAKALAAQQQLVVDRPYDAEVHNDHGNLLVLADRHEEAVEAYRRAIELAPDDALARYNFGVLLQQTGRSKEALAEFRTLLEIDDRHARAHYQLGMLFHGRKQRSRAIEHYAQAFAYDTELTFAGNNPHIIDNDLATEALLMSQRYGETPSSDMPRLYGEPERIVDLMLEEAEAEAAAEEAEARESEVEDGKAPRRARDVKRAGSSSGAYFEADDAEAEDDSEDEEDSEDEGHDSGRTLTSRDLETGSSVGQVQPSQQRGRRSPGARVTGGTQGRAGTSASRPRGRQNRGVGSSTKGGTANTGRPDASANPGRRAPRYRPASRLSTGRLKLELLPARSSTERNAATATR